jgi:hypothetical protein
MANVPQTNPESQLIALRDLPPASTTANGNRKGTPPSEAEAIMLGELEAYRADVDSPERVDKGRPRRQKHVPLQRPESDRWVRVQPVWSYPVHLLKRSTDIRDSWVVLAHLVPDLTEKNVKLKLVDLRYSIDSADVVFFWPSPRGDEFVVHITEREVIAEAEQTWVRLVWNRGTKAFDSEKADTERPLPEPNWPAESVTTVLIRALEKRKISSLDHPVLKGLLTPGG